MTSVSESGGGNEAPPINDTTPATATVRKRKQREQLSKPSELNYVSGISAILVTCDICKEPLAAREIITWLNDTADTLFPRSVDTHTTNDNTKDESTTATSSSSSSVSESTTVISALENELNELRQSSSSSSKNTDADGKKQHMLTSLLHKHKKHSRFIRIPVKMIGNVLLASIDPTVDVLQLVTHMYQRVYTHHELPTRYCIRLQPIQRTCYSSIEHLQKLCVNWPLSERISELIQSSPTLQSIIKDTNELHYAVDFRKRGQNQQLDRTQIIAMIGSCIPKSDKFRIRVDLHAPHVVIKIDSIERITGVCVYENQPYLHSFNIRDMYETVTGIKQQQRTIGTSSKKKDDNEVNDETIM